MGLSITLKHLPPVSSLHAAVHFQCTKVDSNGFDVRTKLLALGNYTGTSSFTLKGFDKPRH